MTSREQVLQTLRDSTEPRTIVELAEELGVHPNTVRFHLEGLAAAGRVDRIMEPTGGLGRPPVKYAATVGMDPAGPTNYRLLATMLTGQFAESSCDPARDARALGRRWSESLIDAPVRGAKRAGTSAIARDRAVSRVVATLADLGFAPEPVAAKATEIRLRHCPFLDLVPANAEVVCSLHLGLMQGIFDVLSSPVTVDRLDPFVRPDLCVASLAPTKQVSS